MPGEVDKVGEAVANFESTNGTRLKELNTKELVLILHKELSEKIDNHIKWGENEDRKVIKALNDHDILFQKIMNVLPEKGFCERVTNELFPKGEKSLSYKVEYLWHDRRWLKYIFIAVLAVGGGNIGINFL